MPMNVKKIKEQIKARIPEVADVRMKPVIKQVSGAIEKMPKQVLKTAKDTGRRIGELKVR